MYGTILLAFSPTLLHSELKKLKKRTVLKKYVEFRFALYQLYTVTLPRVFTALGMIHIILKLEICNLPYL